LFEEDLLMMAQAIAEDGRPEKSLKALAEMLGVDLTEAEKEPHPILKRRLENVFPDYEALKAQATADLNAINIFNPSPAKLALAIYLRVSPVLLGLLRGRGEKAKATVALKVYWQLVEIADDQLEIRDGQTAVAQALEMKQPHVSRAFRKLEDLKLLARSGYDPETGVGVWTLLTPTLAEKR